MTIVRYTSIEIRENKEPIIDLATLGFVLDPKYFQQKFSADARMMLRNEAAQKLMKVQEGLQGFKLKIWDAFRSRDTQNKIYQKYWLELKTAHPEWTSKRLEQAVGEYVSPPYEENQIPPHLTGGAVDLTLTDKNGKELDMGTEFDFFGVEAEPFFYENHKDKPEITKNRRILRKAMTAEGFTLDQSEWWHFDYGNQVWALKSGKPFALYGEVIL